MNVTVLFLVPPCLSFFDLHHCPNSFLDFNHLPNSHLLLSFEAPVLWDVDPVQVPMSWAQVKVLCSLLSSLDFFSRLIQMSIILVTHVYHPFCSKLSCKWLLTADTITREDRLLKESELVPATTVNITLQDIPPPAVDMLKQHGKELLTVSSGTLLLQCPLGCSKAFI